MRARLRFLNSPGHATSQQFHDTFVQGDDWVSLHALFQRLYLRYDGINFDTSVVAHTTYLKELNSEKKKKFIIKKKNYKIPKPTNELIN